MFRKKGETMKEEEKKPEVKPLPMNETVYISEKEVYNHYSYLNPFTRELKVFNQTEDALGLENEVVRVGVYKLDRIICIKKTVSTVQVSCEGAK